MATLSETTDQALLELLRLRGPMTIAELTSAMEVTANAVRQRLARLMGQGLIARSVGRIVHPSENVGRKSHRGRPNHTYSLTERARRQAGDNFADLAVILWREIRSVKDPAVRRGLLQRVADAMAERYRGLIAGANLPERMQSLVALFAERRVPLRVTTMENADGQNDIDAEARNLASAGQLPVLVVEDCPYPQLAEEDRGICAVEKIMFSQLLSEDVRLTQCRLDGHACCQFETS